MHRGGGGETLPLGEGVTRARRPMEPQRRSRGQSGAARPEGARSAFRQRDPTNGGLRPGLAEDFPNGGGSRAYLFTVATRDGPVTIFFSNTGSPVDLDRPIVIDGTNFGAPIDNLRAALRDAGLASVDLWIASGGAPLARLVLPVLRPKAYLPVHWDDYFAPIERGVAKPYADPALESLLDTRARDAGQAGAVPRSLAPRPEWRARRRQRCAEACARTSTVR